MVHSGVLAEDVVSQLGAGDRLPHLRRGQGDGIATQVDNLHAPEHPRTGWSVWQAGLLVRALPKGLVALAAADGGDDLGALLAGKLGEHLLAVRPHVVAPQRDEAV